MGDQAPRGIVDVQGYYPGMSTHKLRAQAQAGQGEIGSAFAAINQLFRTRDPEEPAARVVLTPLDVTRGLGLSEPVAARVQRLVSETNVAYRPNTATQRLVHGRARLVEALRTMDLDSDVRQEITRRGLAYWQRQSDTGLNRSPTMRFVVKAETFFGDGASEAHGPMLIVKADRQGVAQGLRMRRPKKKQKLIDYSPPGTRAERSRAKVQKRQLAGEKKALHYLGADKFMTQDSE